MTLSTAGFPGEVTSPQWSRLIDIVGNDGTIGFNVDPASGDRTVSVSSGLSNVGGILFMSDATETVELPENSSNRSRIDRIILRADWSTPRGYITYRRGTASSAPIPPALTREPGVQYEVPIAEVTVGPGQGSLTASDVVRTNTPPASGFYWIGSRAQAPDPANSALVWYNPGRELWVATSSGYQTVAGLPKDHAQLSSPGGSGWDHQTTYRVCGNEVEVNVSVYRTGGSTSPNNVRLGILPGSARPPRPVYRQVMNQHSGESFTVEVDANGTVTCIGMRANSRQRIRGGFTFLL